MKNEKEKQSEPERKENPAPPEQPPETEIVQEIEILNSDEIPGENAPEPSGDDAKPGLQAQIEAAVREQEDRYLRLLAEYDNFRKRSIKERETAWSTAKADTAAAFLPVYDNLERALKQECKDEAYVKGVQMTMSQFKAVLEKLGIEEIPALGLPFDPAVHDAVMHIKDESLDKNVIVEVFQAGFQTGERIIRHAMVKVAN